MPFFISGARATTFNAVGLIFGFVCRVIEVVAVEYIGSVKSEEFFFYKKNIHIQKDYLPLLSILLLLVYPILLHFYFAPISREKCLLTHRFFSSN